jgi:hypothetical protein
MGDLLTHTDFTWGYRLQYPADWQKQPTSPTAIHFFSPLENPGDVFRDNVGVEIDETIVSLAEYVDFSINQVRTMAPNFQFGPRAATVLAGLPAEQFDMTGQLGPFIRNSRPEMLPVRYRIVAAKKEKRVLTLTFTAEARAFEKFLPSFEAMTQSMQLSG